MVSISLINATPYIWYNLHNHSYQISNWRFPNSIQPGQIAQVNFDYPLSGSSVDTAGEVRYSVANQNSPGFELRLHGTGGNIGLAESYKLSVAFGDVATSTSKAGSVQGLDFNDDVTPFILSGDKNNFQYNAVRMDWLQSILPYVGCQPLNKITLTGSHDSGMSKLGKTKGGISDDTLTQSLDIAGQLGVGVRYFDIRPVLRNGVYNTGHYDHNDVLGWVGGDGQSMASIISQVNAFLDKYSELVILELSHDMDVSNNFAPFSQATYKTLLEGMSSLKHRYVAASSSVDLSTIPLNTFIKTGPAVIVLVPKGIVIPPNFDGKGFYNTQRYSKTGSYGQTDSLKKMVSDQLTKMNAATNPKTISSFHLHWYLTQNLGDIVGTGIRSLKVLARYSRNELFRAWQSEDSKKTSLWASLSANGYPNVIILDDWKNGNPTALAVAINRYTVPQCSNTVVSAQAKSVGSLIMAGLTPS